MSLKVKIIRFPLLIDFHYDAHDYGLIFGVTVNNSGYGVIISWYFHFVFIDIVDE